MKDSQQILKDHILELCNELWLYELGLIRKEANKVKGYDINEDTDYNYLQGKAAAYRNELRKLISKLGNSELSLYINRLKLN